jgi:hypothetical protein
MEFVAKDPFLGHHVNTCRTRHQRRTQMRKLHEWYMVVAKSEQEMFIMKVTDEHYLGEDEIHINFEELFQLYNQDALDKSLVSGYCV